MFPTSNPLPHTLSNTKTFEFLLIFFHLVLTSYHMTSIKIFSDDPNGIQLGVPIVTDNGFGHHTKKVLTPEMVNLGIKVANISISFRFLSVSKCCILILLTLFVKVMSYAVRGPLAIRAVELEKEIKAVCFALYHAPCFCHSFKA